MKVEVSSQATHTATWRRHMKTTIHVGRTTTNTGRILFPKSINVVELNGAPWQCDIVTGSGVLTLLRPYHGFCRI